MTCRKAAQYGHLGVLKYAHENGCPWDERTCRAAARGGHLDVLKYARENGCPWDAGTWYAVLVNPVGDSCRDWLVENGCPQEYELID